MTDPAVTALALLLLKQLEHIDAQAAEIERLNKGFHESCIAREESLKTQVTKLEEKIKQLRAIQQDIGGIGGCNNNSGIRAIDIIDKLQRRLKEIEDESFYLR